MVKLKSLMNQKGFFTVAGGFAAAFMIWLFVGPKLVKKPAGTPPRSGSNEETKQVNRVAAGLPPQPTKGGFTTMTPPSMNLPKIPNYKGLGGPLPVDIGAGSGAPTGLASLAQTGSMYPFTKVLIS